VNVIAKIFFAVVLITAALRSATVAQTQGGMDPKACSDAADGGSSQSLSNRLGQSNGVLCPPNVDPGMNTPASDTGKMPVIPPPGSPGGNPNVQPK
jgi:hypothetical protein